MKGGGHFKVGRGQVTDDSELAMCLMHGLIDNENNIKNGAISFDKIAIRYRDWI